MNNEYDAVIVGGGVGGLGTGIMLGRARRRVLVVDSGLPRNRFARHMHSFLGSEGVPPLELLERGRADYESFGGEVVDGRVDGVAEGPDGLVLDIAGRPVRTRALVLATGVTDELPAIPGLAERWGIDVVHCPYCHGYEFGGRRLGVLLSSPLSIHLAKQVRQWSDDVTLFLADGLELSAEDRAAFAARGMRIRGPIAEVRAEGDRLVGVRTADGEQGLDALFVTPSCRPNDALVASLGLDRADGPMGSFLAVDPMGRTSHPRIWAVGNVVNPGLNVAMTVGAAAMAGGAVNGALVEEDFARALAHGHDAVAPAAYWEARYAEREQVWSGRVNRVLADVAAELAPGRALDLGCGEGGDVVWLAEQGWEAVGVDISEIAVARGRSAAAGRGVAGRARFVALDLTDTSSLSGVGASFDLVTASFFQSPVALDRAGILRAAAELVAPGGTLLVTSHAAPPPWASAEHLAAFHAITPESELASLGLDPEAWEVQGEIKARAATSPDGVPAELSDCVVRARRRV
ncbi:MAG: bifunctional NAD(P)/FAD-dependent oxidoreductase/class I SAM-dependent methyltransferase [Arachnia sp.]